MLNDQEIINYINGGMSLNKLAKMCGVSTPTLSIKVKKLGLAVNTKFFKLAIPIDEIKQKYESGQNISNIAKFYGMTVPAVYLRLKKLGIIRAKNIINVSDGDLVRVVNLSVKEAAKELAISAARLHRLYIIYNKNHAFLYPIETFKKKYSNTALGMLASELGGNKNDVLAFMRIYNIEVNKRDLEKVKILPKLNDKFIRKIKRLTGSVNEKAFRYKDFSIIPHHLDDNNATFVVQSGIPYDDDRKNVFHASYVCLKNNLNVNYINIDGNPINPKWDDFDTYYARDWSLIFDNHNDCHKWLVKFGFHHPQHPNRILDRGVELCLKIDGSLDSNVGAPSTMDLIKHFSPHFYYSCRDNYLPITDAWEKGNLTILRDALQKIWDDEPNIYKLVTKIKNSKKDFNAVSIFKPWIAKFVYDEYLPDGGIVVDPCMGWGGRLLGCMDKKIIYYGYDLNPYAVESNKNLHNFIKDHMQEAHFECSDSSKCNFREGDILFTSPPYNSVELYYGIDSKKTVTSDILKNIFCHSYKFIIINVHEALKNMCINLSSPNYSLYKEHKMASTTLYGDRKPYNEPILVFKNNYFTGKNCIVTNGITIKAV